MTIQNDFNSNTDGFVLYGNAVNTGTVIELTGTLSNRKGSFFTNNGYSVTSFTARFDFKIGPTSGADGLTFAFVKTPGVGDSGSGLGFKGLSGYAVEFDTYGEFSNKDHIAVIKNDPKTHIVFDSDIPTLTTDTWHHVDVQFDKGRIQVWLNNIKYIDYTIKDYWPSITYFGCTGSTGGITNSHIIDNFSVSFNSGPGAYFLTPDSFKLPQSVPFDSPFADLSIGDISSWLWDFGDGATSTEEIPHHTYTKPGHYTVSLTVTNQEGSDTFEQKDLIHAVEWNDKMIENSSTSYYYAYPYSYFINDLDQYVISAGDPGTGHGKFNIYSKDGTIVHTVGELRGLPFFWTRQNGSVLIGDGFNGSTAGSLYFYNENMEFVWSASTIGKPNLVRITPDEKIIYVVSEYNENILTGSEYNHKIKITLYAFDLDGNELWANTLYSSLGSGNKNFTSNSIHIDKNNGVLLGTGSSSAGEGFVYSVNKDGVVNYQMATGGYPLIAVTPDGSKAFVTANRNVFENGRYQNFVSTTTIETDLVVSGRKYSKDEVDQAVADAVAQKDQTISSLNSQIASLFTQEQLDEAVNELKTAKDTIIAQKDQTISSLNSQIASQFTQAQLDEAVNEVLEKFDINRDGQLGFPELLHILQVLSGNTK